VTEKQMEMDRREFVKLTVGALVGCESGAQAAPPPHPEGSRAGSPIDAGPVSQYATDGIYDAHQEKGFFVVRHGADLFAVASICTHRRCRLRPEPNHTFLCPCHGSRFDPDGHVTRGPATRDLPHFQTTIDDRGHLLVTLA
jgi:nitrite reductase/ring-hydroxylating ferredoxin subunit